MGKVLHTIRKVGDTINAVMMGGFTPISAPLDLIDDYVEKDRPKLKKLKINKKEKEEVKEAKGA